MADANSFLKNANDFKVLLPKRQKTSKSPFYHVEAVLLRQIFDRTEMGLSKNHFECRFRGFFKLSS